MQEGENNYSTLESLDAFSLMDEASSASAKLIKDKTGVSAIEFALLAPLLIIVFVGVVNLGLVVSAKFNLENTLYTASNYIMANGNQSDQGQINTIFENGRRNTSIVSPYVIKQSFYDEDQKEINNCLTFGSQCSEGDAFYVKLTVETSISNLLFDKFSPDTLVANSYIRLQ